MNVELHIERLVLDGISLDSAGQNLLREAMRTELTRLIVEGGVTPPVSGTAPLVAGTPILAGPGCGPIQMGVQLARSVYGGIGKPSK